MMNNPLFFLILSLCTIALGVFDMAYPPRTPFWYCFGAFFIVAGSVQATHWVRLIIKANRKS
jgi:hypothetical protein